MGSQADGATGRHLDVMELLQLNARYYPLWSLWLRSWGSDNHPDVYQISGIESHCAAVSNVIFACIIASRAASGR